MGGFSPVAVLPEFRGRGLGRAVTAGQFAAMREQGEVISGLFPASQALYRSVGFEIAGSYVLRRFPASEIGRIRPTRPVEVRRGLAADVAAIHRCQEHLAPGRDGTLRRDPSWWERRLPSDLDGVVVYVVDDAARPGELAGYAIYRHGPGPRPYDYTVVVTEVLADDPDVVQALWRVVGSSGSQAPWVEVVGPAEDDLFLLLDSTDPVAVRNEIRWMLRLVDAAGGGGGARAGTRTSAARWTWRSSTSTRRGTPAAGSSRWPTEAPGSNAVARVRSWPPSAGCRVGGRATPRPPAWPAPVTCTPRTRRRCRSWTA